MQEPLPGEPRHDERHCKGIEKDGSEHALEADMLIDEHGEKEPKHQSARDEQNAEHKDVPSGGDEALGCEQAFELLQADEVEDRQHFRTAKGESYSPDHRADID